MQLYKIRGGTKEELENKHYNIGVGISLGNKWFTPENIVEAVKWSLLYTQDYVIIYVADYIHAINLEVRNGINNERALRIASKKGQNLIELVKEKARSTFTEKENSKIFYFFWSDLLTKEYKDKTRYLYDLYESNTIFRNCIIECVKSFTKDELKKFNESDIKKMGTYILEELSELICRVPIGGKVFDAYVYPFDSVVTELAEKIQRGEFLPEIKLAIMDTAPKVFLEVR